MLYAPAWQARIPAVVGTGSLLSSANALSAASSGAVRLVGGPLGGILLALCGARWLIGVDAASYLLSALALTLTSRTPAAPPAVSPARAPAAGVRTRSQPRDPARPPAWPAAAAAYLGLFTSSSLDAALPAAAAVGMFGSMSLVIPQTVMPRVVPNAVLGRTRRRLPHRRGRRHPGRSRGRAVHGPGGRAHRGRGRAPGAASRWPRPGWPASWSRQRFRWRAG